MCVVSMVHDHFQPLIPDPTQPWKRDGSAVPSTSPPAIDLGALFSGEATLAEFKRAVAEARQVIEDFKAAVAAAKKVDALTKQPDCVDPEKAKLVERVAELEKRLDAIERAKAPKKKARKAPRAATET